jgi:hypothetical protein
VHVGVKQPALVLFAPYRGFDALATSLSTRSQTLEDQGLRQPAAIFAVVFRAAIMACWSTGSQKSCYVADKKQLTRFQPLLLFSIRYQLRSEAQKAKSLKTDHIPASHFPSVFSGDFPMPNRSRRARARWVLQLVLARASPPFQPAHSALRTGTPSSACSLPWLSRQVKGVRHGPRGDCPPAPGCVAGAGSHGQGSSDRGLLGVVTKPRSIEMTN